MKFIALILLVAVASSVYGSLAITPDNLPVECQQELNNSKEYNNCTEYQPSFETYKQKCQLMLSNGCQAFYQNPMSYLPKCKGTVV